MPSAAPLPPALKDMGSLEFSKQLLTHAKVAVAPKTLTLTFSEKLVAPLSVTLPHVLRVRASTASPRCNRLHQTI